MNDFHARLLFLVIYAAGIYFAWQFARWFVHLFPEQAWYVGAPALVILGLYLVIRDCRSSAAGTNSEVQKPPR